MYRDHRKGPGGSTGWGHLSRRGPWAEVGGNQPLVGWCAPLGPPPAPRVGNPRVGGHPTCLGGQATPLGRHPPSDGISRGPAPPRAPINSGGREGSSTTAPGASLSPCNTSPSRRSSAKPCRDPRYIHHHAVVLLDLHQPLLPPCWIKKEETSLLRTCVERGGAVCSALGHR